MNLLQYIPDIDYWFAKYWGERGELTTVHIPVPEILSDLPPSAKGSFIQLLFSETFPFDVYFYKFKSVSITTFPKRIQERIRRKHNLDSYYFASSEGTIDLYQLNEQTLYMLDMLYNYRQGETFTLNGSGIVYGDLTRLGKLIYIYLEVMLDDNYEKLAYPELLPSGNELLENLFEFYVLNEAHKKLRNSTFLVDSHEENLKPLRLQFKINLAIANQQYISLLGDEMPSNLAELYVYHNGVFLNPTQYSILSDSSSVIISWADTGLNVKDFDIIVVDYYVPLVEKTSDGLRTGLLKDEPSVGEI